jgi:hypothetical protein
MPITYSKEVKRCLPTQKVRSQDEGILILLIGVVRDVAHSCCEGKFRHNVFRITEEGLQKVLLRVASACKTTV